MEKKKVLLLGDSIRINYQQEVKSLLAEKADVFYPDDNGRFASYTLCSLGGYLNLGSGGFDVIHWNNGNWDASILSHMNEVFSTIEHYLSEMARIHSVLSNTRAKIIFATTTAVKPKVNDINNSRIEYYNACVTAMLRAKGVVINDLYTPVKENLDEYLCEDDLHLSEAGIKAIGKIVADKITEVLQL